MVKLYKKPLAISTMHTGHSARLFVGLTKFFLPIEPYFKAKEAIVPLHLLKFFHNSKTITLPAIILR